MQNSLTFQFKMKFQNEIELTKYTTTIIHCQTSWHYRRDLLKIKKLLNIDKCYFTDLDDGKIRMYQNEFLDEKISDEEFDKILYSKPETEGNH